MEKTQSEINEWERLNQDRIIKWEKDFEKMTITFNLINPHEEIIFKIIQ
jgi:hypothetical protein